jgi:uncharacterized BrkB/YihY/UPF0761 family membrane protein
MSHPTSTWRKVMAQPGHFTLQVLNAFQKNQGLLLSGALAYYILLSVIPLFTFLLLMLSHVVDEAALLPPLSTFRHRRKETLGSCWTRLPESSLAAFPNAQRTDQRTGAQSR